MTVTNFLAMRFKLGAEANGFRIFTDSYTVDPHTSVQNPPCVLPPHAVYLPYVVNIYLHQGKTSHNTCLQRKPNNLSNEYLILSYFPRTPLLLVLARHIISSKIDATAPADSNASEFRQSNGSPSPHMKSCLPIALKFGDK